MVNEMFNALLFGGHFVAAKVVNSGTLQSSSTTNNYSERIMQYLDSQWGVTVCQYISQLTLSGCEQTEPYRRAKMSRQYLKRQLFKTTAVSHIAYFLFFLDKFISTSKPERYSNNDGGTGTTVVSKQIFKYSPPLRSKRSPLTVTLFAE